MRGRRGACPGAVSRVSGISSFSAIHELDNSSDEEEVACDVTPTRRDRSQSQEDSRDERRFLLHCHEPSASQPRKARVTGKFRVEHGLRYEFDSTQNLKLVTISLTVT